VRAHVVDGSTFRWFKALRLALEATLGVAETAPGRT
jgi:hypothetical protein